MDNMSDDIKFEISIPADNDGYILLRCSHCGEFFKLTAKDCEDDGTLNIYCPSCGLISESYLTQDVIELAQTIASNYAMDMIYEAFKDMEKSTKKNSFVSFYDNEGTLRGEMPIINYRANSILPMSCFPTYNKYFHISSSLYLLYYAVNCFIILGRIARSEFLSSLFTDFAVDFHFSVLNHYLRVTSGLNGVNQL